MLGPVEASRDGAVLQLGSPRQRLVLALLASHNGRVVSTDRLIDEIWGENPPIRALHSLHTYISNLRGVFGGADGDGSRLVTQKPGYLLDVQASQLDAARFEELAAEGRQKLHDSPAEARRALQNALDLWRGPPFEGLGDQAPSLTADAVRLEELRLGVVEDRTEADLALGEHHSVISGLEVHLRQHPLRERFAEQLMTALYRSGRQAEALRVYQRTRRQLSDELGIDPSPALQRLEERILLQDEDLEREAEAAAVEAEASGPSTTARASRRHRLVLLEREAELRLMADLLDGVGSSGGKVVLVRGEAGIGKSALVREFVEMHRDEASVLFGSCDDLLTRQPMGPFWDISRVEASLAEPLENGDRRTVMGILLDILSRSPHPTILVIEDTQWADEATLDAVKYLGRRIAHTHGLLLLTYRDGEVDYDHPLRQVIGELPPEVLVRIHLEGLSPQAIADLAGTADRDVDEILTLTGGNPLFVTEVLASGVEKVPTSIQDSVLARAAKLSPEARQVLDLASVIPGEAELSLIVSILGSAREHMTECSRQGLLRVGESGVSFHHELTRRSVESVLNAQDRRRLNQLVLIDLVGRADPARLVHHAREADDVDSIIEFAPLAARAAMAIESHQEAAAHFRLLEPYLDRISDDERAAIVDDWARTEYYLISSESADILARAISLHRSTGNDLALAGALTFAVRVNEVAGRPELAEAASREAITILESYPVGANLAAAVSQRAWLMKMRGDRSTAVEAAERAIELAEATGDEPTLINALITKGHFTFRSGDPAGFRVLEEARSRAERAGLPFEETLALLNMAEVAAEHRDVERAGELSQRARDAAARHEIRINEQAANAHCAKVLDWKGEWDEAEDIASETASALHSGVLDSQAEQATGEGSATEAPRHVVFYSQLVAGQVLGPLQARQGRPAALSTLTSIWGRADVGDEMQILLPSAAGLAEYMWLHGEHDPALTARFREVLNDPRRLTFPWSAGWLVYWLWMLGELSDAPEGIAEPYRLVMEGRPTEAATIWDMKGIPYERGLALMHGDETARLEALEVFETLGATAAAAKLRRALRAEGVGVPRGRGRETRRHGVRLTARQAEVLQLLDEGLSNTEIADLLFVSPRTVENHVSAVLTKLDSSTRKEAVVRARAEGLISVSDDRP